MDTIYLSDRGVALRYEASRATIWRWVKDEGLPSPIKLSSGCTRWKLSELVEWELAREREGRQ